MQDLSQKDIDQYPETENFVEQGYKIRATLPQHEYSVNLFSVGFQSNSVRRHTKAEDLDNSERENQMIDPSINEINLPKKLPAECKPGCVNSKSWS